MSGTARVIPLEDVFARIGTRDPYYALRTLAAFKAGVVEAEVPVQLESALEQGPITAGEAARHLGLLATCALAEANPDRSLHYYLVRKGTLERSGSMPTASRLEGRATAEMIGTQAGRATATLQLRGGSTLFKIDTEFTVLNAVQFQKLFDGAKRDLRKTSRPPVADRRPTGELKVMRKNPYGAPLKFSNVDASPGMDVIEATFGPIPPEACAGHYPMYPVLPTGIVMTALSQLAGTLLKRRLGEVKYIVRHAEARADNLALSGELVRFEARFVGGSTRNYRFECKARCGSKPVGAVSMTLQLA